MLNKLIVSFYTTFNKTISIIFLILLFCTGTAKAANVLDFEGLKNQEQILNFYNGGTGSMGSSSGQNYGVYFGSNALAIIDQDAGGSGNFGHEPSPDTAMFFLTGSAVLNMPDGFGTGFSFYYSSVNVPGNVKVYDGLDATGNVLATLDLPTTPRDGGDPNGSFSPFYSIGVGFTGSAKSIDFSGTVNQIAFDDITIGSVTPSVNANMPFLVGDVGTNPIYSSRTTSQISVNGDTQNGFDPTLPTYVVTHGWQPGQDHLDSDFDFKNQAMPETQRNIVDAITERLGTVAANIITFEWEGAYTGGEGNDGESNRNGAREARINADYAGILLGRALQDKLGGDYNQDLHFIGHSYGTVVNGLATRYLERDHLLTDAQTIQFTVLDSPTNAPFGFAPNLNADWFANNLSPQVNYVDNYYGKGALAYGEQIQGAGLNQQVDYDHSGVASEFYPDLIRNGPNADTNPDGIGDNMPRGFRDWITPILPTYESRLRPDFSTAAENQWRQAVTNDFTNAIGQAYTITNLPGYDNYAFTGLYLEEQSPVSIFYSLDIPWDAEWLYFDWMIGDGGDGDWITVHFGSELLWSMGISDFLEGILLNAMLDISAYAGMYGDLYFTLNSVGDTNAAFYIGNLQILGSFDHELPEPSTLILFLVGLAGLYWSQRKSQYGYR